MITGVFCPNCEIGAVAGWLVSSSVRGSLSRAATVRGVSLVMVAQTVTWLSSLLYRALMSNAASRASLIRSGASGRIPATVGRSSSRVGSLSGAAVAWRAARSVSVRVRSAYSSA